mmetsp:Transcript_4902/g.9198  ORF Transcript_4902/g.9198 Transcript_4902/m.9198 type:complete len:258 (-) Transcript_4902:1203-1976(-)
MRCPARGHPLKILCAFAKCSSRPYHIWDMARISPMLGNCLAGAPSTLASPLGGLTSWSQSICFGAMLLALPPSLLDQPCRVVLVLRSKRQVHFQLLQHDVPAEERRHTGQAAVHHVRVIDITQNRSFDAVHQLHGVLDVAQAVVHLNHPLLHFHALVHLSVPHLAQGSKQLVEERGAHGFQRKQVLCCRRASALSVRCVAEEGANQRLLQRHLGQEGPPDGHVARQVAPRGGVQELIQRVQEAVGALRGGRPGVHET